MRAAAELRKQIESALADRIPAALSFRPPLSPELLSCGLPEVNAILGGGLPLGAITELMGVRSSGRTTLVLAALAEVTRQGESCAYVDVSDALNPLSAASLGVDLRRLLWVRSAEHGSAQQGSGVSDLARAGSPSPSAAPTPSREKLSQGAGWCHPRNEAIGLHHAVGELFHTAHSEPVDFTPRCSESLHRERPQPVAFAAPKLSALSAQRPPNILNLHRETSWTRLDQALRASDLLLSTGGFRALVLDMGDVSPEQARRVPLTTWYRFRLQVEKSRTLFLLMTRALCANSCAAVSLHCRQDAIQWHQAAVHSPLLLAGLRYRISVERSRTIDPIRKKSAASAETVWSSTAPWSR